MTTELWLGVADVVMLIALIGTGLGVTFHEAGYRWRGVVDEHAEEIDDAAEYIDPVAAAVLDRGIWG